MLEHALIQVKSLARAGLAKNGHLRAAGLPVARRAQRQRFTVLLGLSVRGGRAQAANSPRLTHSDNGRGT